MSDGTKQRRVLVTGANGFIGTGLCAALRANHRFLTRAAIRHPAPAGENGIEHVRIDSLAADTDWCAALAGIDCVVHTAARIQVRGETETDPLTVLRQANVDGTMALARQAAETGVRRFVFLSSIKVNGEETAPGKPFAADDALAPIDAYGQSKREAEDGIRAIAKETGMEAVIIRPVLVYGPGVGANFERLMAWLTKGLPLPLGAVDNRRSLVARDNLVDLIVTTLTHDAAADQTFLVSDGDDVSTPDLLRRMAAALGTRARLLPVPVSMLTAAAALFGRADMARRLCGSLQVDIGKTRSLLGWSPPVGMDAGLRETAAHFLDRLDR